MDGTVLNENLNYQINIPAKIQIEHVVSEPYQIANQIFPEKTILTATTERLLVFNVMATSVQSYTSVPACVVFVRMYNPDGTLKFITNTVGLYSGDVVGSANKRAATFNDIDQQFPLLEVGEYLTAQVLFITNTALEGVQFEFKTWYKSSIPSNLKMVSQILSPSDFTIYPLITDKHSIPIFEFGSKSSEFTTTTQITVPNNSSIPSVDVFPDYNPSKNSTFLANYSSIFFNYAGYPISIVAQRINTNPYAHPRILPGYSVSVRYPPSATVNNPPVLVFSIVLVVADE